MELDGKVALVTGAGSGIGKAAALRIAREGAAVGVLSHTGNEAEASADEVAELVLFLISDRASHVSGTPVWIDGAQSLLVG